MQEKVILDKLSELPELMKIEVLHYIEYLSLKHNHEKKDKSKKPKFGSSLGKYEISDDFDEPLKEFGNLVT